MMDSGIVIRRATPGDFKLARQAIAEVNLPTSHYAGPVDDGALSDFLADLRNYLLLAVEEERVAGSLYGYALQSPYQRRPQFMLYGIDVRPEFSGRSIGTALVNSFIAEARSAEASEVWTMSNESNKAAMKMYTRCGLAGCATDDVVLVLPLK